ncbi:MAG: hypothetical protein V1682_05735 [Candidatus Omnitrophota bacterium]
MIRLTISGIMFLYTLFSVIIILVVWIVSGYRLEKRALPKDVDYIWKCSVCFNTYVDSKHDDISVCTLCGSYNKRDK